MHSETNSIELGKVLLKLMQSKVPKLKIRKIELAPPRFCCQWLVAMLGRILTMVKQYAYTKMFLDLAKQAFSATSPYIHDTVPEELVVDIYSEFSKILCRDP